MNNDLQFKRRLSSGGCLEDIFPPVKPLLLQVTDRYVVVYVLPCEIIALDIYD